MANQNIMDYCAVIVLKNIHSKHLKAHEIKVGEKDHFHFMGRKEDKYLIYQNVGSELSEPEYEALKRYVKTWGGGESVDCVNGILQIEAPRFMWEFLERVNKIPGCRIAPNTLQNEGDAYISIEFQEINQIEVSKAIMDFLTADHIFAKELIYFGPQNVNLPHILSIYEEFGNTLRNFSVIKTVWQSENDDLSKQNMGIFLNKGFFLPKYFVDHQTDRLISKLESIDIKGDAEYKIVDEEKKIVEFNVQSKFFSDFYKEVIEHYSGPIFYSLQSDGRRLTNTYVVERNVQQLFMRGLSRHWNLPARKNHKNFISEVGYLDQLSLSENILC